MKYHQKREFIQSLPFPRRVIQLLEAFLERGTSCRESQENIAARKGVSVDTVGRAIRFLTEMKRLDKFDVVQIIKRGRGLTNVYSIDWKELNRVAEFVFAGGKLQCQESAKCGIKNPQNAESSIRTMRIQESAKCGVCDTIDEMNFEMPPEKRGGGGFQNSESGNEHQARQLVESFYRRRPSEQNESGILRDVDFIAEFIAVHGLEIVQEAIRKLPDRLGPRSDRKFLRGCRTTLGELIALEVKSRREQASREKHNAGLKQMYGQWDSAAMRAKREQDELLGWLGDQPIEVQQRIREAARSDLSQTKYGALFWDSFLVEAIKQHRGQQ